MTKGTENVKLDVGVAYIRTGPPFLMRTDKHLNNENNDKWIRVETNEVFLVVNSEPCAQDSNNNVWLQVLGAKGSGWLYFKKSNISLADVKVFL